MTAHLARIRALPFALRLAPILLLGSVLSLVRLSAPDLWLDEGISYWIARKPLWEVVSYSLSRAFEHPPVYYMMLHGWMRLVGDSEFALRALSWIGMVTATSVVASLARRWFSDKLALLAAVIVVANPMVVDQARDARMYPWLMVFAPLSVYLLDRAVARNRWRDWGLFLIVAALGIGTHYLFGLICLCYALFFVIRWPRLPASRSRFALIFGFFSVIGFLSVLAVPGLRASVLEGFAILLQTPRDPEWVWDLLREWAAGANFRNLPLVAMIPIVALVWGLAVVGVQRARSLSRRQETDLPWLLALLIFLPPVIGVLTMPTSTPRQTSASLPMLLLAVAIGLVAVIRRVRWLGIGLMVGVLGLGLGLSAVSISIAERPFANPLDYIHARASEGEPLVYTYYFDWPLDSYYNRSLPYFNVVPERHQEVSETVIAERAAAVMATGAPSFWLMLFPGPANTDRAERAFNALAFPGERTWFPSGRGVIHYFAPRPLTEQSGDFNWDDQIGLVRWGVDSQAVQAGDALRLQFQWRKLGASDASLLFALTLVASDGSIWANRVSAPCNSRCSTETWTDAVVTDKLAFYVPSDVPPGDYHLHAAWLTPEGTPLLGRSSHDTTGQVDLPLMPVHVTLPASTATQAPFLGKPVGAVLRDGLTLRSIEFNDPVVRAGAALAIPVQLAISAPQPELELQLWLEQGGERVSVAQPLAPAWHPSSTWMPGRMLRVQPRFVIPAALSPGKYRASLAIAAPGAGAAGEAFPIGVMVLEDRPRLFEMPEQGVALDAECDQGIRLARFELPRSTLPGSTVPVTLTWQAGGPAQRNWKVYIHVRDAQNVTVAQVDGYPAGGTVLTTSWMPGEVIIDMHPLFLPTDLPAQDYAVRVGFYDESTFERLRCGDDDGVTLPAPLRVDVQ